MVLYYVFVANVESRGGKTSNTFIISPNEVFGDIMVLESPPHPPVDLDDVNALNSKNIQRISFKFYMTVDTPCEVHCY